MLDWKQMTNELLEIILIQQRLLNDVVNHWNPEVQKDFKKINELLTHITKEEDVQSKKGSQITRMPS